METLKLRNINYKIISNYNDYDLELTKENILCFKRGGKLYVSIHLDKVCLGTKLFILEHLGLKIEREEWKTLFLYFLIILYVILGNNGHSHQHLISHLR